MADVQEIAQGLVALCRAEKFEEATETYYASDIVSVEADGEKPEVRGIEAVREKSASFYGAFEVHGVEVSGPFVNGSQFLVGFAVDLTHKASGSRSITKEMGLYTVRDGKIAEERFFTLAA